MEINFNYIQTQKLMLQTNRVEKVNEKKKRGSFVQSPCFLPEI